MKKPILIVGIIVASMATMPGSAEAKPRHSQHSHHKQVCKCELKKQRCKVHKVKVHKTRRNCRTGSTRAVAL